MSSWELEAVGAVQPPPGAGLTGRPQVESPFPDRRGCPRQAALVPAAEAVVRFVRRIQPESLQGLAEYSHVWVLFMFSENCDPLSPADAPGPSLKYGEAWSGGAQARARRKGRTWPSRVAAPRLAGGKTGVFATRSPHRPNPIGLSVCALLGVDPQDRTIRLGGVDLVDGTPVLDIKPYVPYDAVPQCAVPEWVGHNSGATEREIVEFSPEASEALERLASEPGAARRGLNKRTARLVLRAYAHRPEQLRLCVQQVVAQDPRSVHQGRGSQMAQESFNITIDGLEIGFSVLPDKTIVNSVSPLMPQPAGAPPESPSDRPADCRQLLERWLSTVGEGPMTDDLAKLVEQTRAKLTDLL